MNNLITAEQSVAVSDISPKLTVSAAAGSGKTSVLVWRYLRHVIEDGMDPSSLLTVTFTVKAAEEMRRRIVRELNNLGRRDLSALAESGPIGTIHSLCERILRQFSIDLGMDPAFEVLPNETAQIWLDNAVRSSFLDCATRDFQLKKMIEIEAFQLDKPWLSDRLTELLKSIALTVNGLRSTGKEISEIERRYESPDSTLAFWRSWFLTFVPVDQKNRIAKLGNSFEAVTEFQKIKSPNWIGKELKKLDAKDEMESAERTSSIMKVACSSWAEYELRCHKAQKLDFIGLERGAIRLLELKPEAGNHLREKFSRLIVDEAQDLNPVQHQLINLLGIESEMMVGDSRQSIYGFRYAAPHLFESRSKRTESHRHLGLTYNHRSTEGILRVVNMVTNYHWKAQVFSFPGDSKSDSNPFELEVVESRRSKPWPNEVLLWPLSFQELGQDLCARTLAANISTLIVEGETAGEIAVLVHTWRHALRIRDQLKARGIDAQLAGGSNGLFTRLEARDLANILTSLADPLDDFCLLTVLRGPLANLSMDSIVELSQKSPIIAEVEGFLPLVESDNQKLKQFLSWYLPLAKVADQLSAWEVISKVFAEGKLMEATARRPGGLEMAANLRKLARIAAEQPEKGPLEFAKSIREIQKIRHEISDASVVDKDADAVVITTIHKAKGLEFPVVILGEPIIAGGKNESEIKHEPLDGVVCLSEFGRRIPAAKLIEEVEARSQREEGLRLLYVAMTRAKRKLCLPLCLKARKEGFAKWLSQVPEIKAQLELINTNSENN